MPELDDRIAQVLTDAEALRACMREVERKVAEGTSDEEYGRLIELWCVARAAWRKAGGTDPHHRPGSADDTAPDGATSDVG